MPLIKGTFVSLQRPAAFTLPCLARSEICGDPPLLLHGEVCLTGETRIARDLSRLVSEMGTHIIDKRNKESGILQLDLVIGLSQKKQAHQRCMVTRSCFLNYYVR